MPHFGMRFVVTGSSRGIGHAIVEELRRAGHDVIGVSRTEGIDVRDPDLEWMLDSLADVDGVITCAGVASAPVPLVELKNEDWDESMQVNLTHHMRLARWFMKRDRPGPIIMIASTAGTRPSPQWYPYAAAKAGLINFGLSLAAEAAPGFRVYVVAPGRCATNLRRTLVPLEDPCTIMQPGEVAQVVHTLVDDVAAVMSGQVIEVARRC